MSNKLILILAALLALSSFSLSAKSQASSFMKSSSKLSYCAKSVKTSPIELNYPEMSFSAFKVDMTFNRLSDAKITKLENNHVKYTGDFGTVGYQAYTYKVLRVDVYSPALHMVQGVVHPLEVQVKAKSSEGGYITLCYMFDKMGAHVNQFLKDGWFADHKIKSMPVAPQGHKMKDGISLKDLVEDKKGYFLYEGQSITDDCEPSLYFISNELSWMSETQYGELIPLSQAVPTVAKPKAMKLYQNVDPNLLTSPKKITEPLSLMRFPSTISASPYMYAPNNFKQFGTIESKYIPAWEVDPKKVKILKSPRLSKLPQGMKYEPYYYEKTKKGEYFAYFIIVSSDFSFTKNVKPKKVPIFVRTQTQYPNGVRDIIQLDMPCFYTPKDLAQEKALAKLKKEEEEKKKKAAAKQKHKEIKAKKAKAKKEAEAAARRKKNIIFKRVCQQWSIISVVNRFYENKDAWNLQDLMRGGKRDLLVCKKWKVVMVNDNGEEVDKEGNVIPKKKQQPKKKDDKKKPKKGAKKPKKKAPKPDPALGKVNVKKCGNYLLTVLNQRFKDKRVKDYYIDKCKDWKSKILPKATALAMVSSSDALADSEPIKKLSSLKAKASPAL